MATDAFREHFPGLATGWARFDGPGGTLMVDAAVEAMRAYSSSTAVANVGGPFGPSVETGEMVERCRLVLAELLGAPAAGIVFGPNMTTLTFAFTRAMARDFGPSDEIVCTQLDHDANVTPWVLAAEDRGARVVMAPIDPSTGRLPVEAVEQCLTDRTRWVAVTGASNLIGTIPDLPAIVRVAHDAGARVFVDAVHLTPHRRVDMGALGCDALITSPYKWYGPHAGVLALAPDLVDTVAPYKVRPAPASGPRRFETGTPSFEAIAGIEAAARFLLAEDMDRTAAVEHDVFAVLLDGLHSMRHVTVHPPSDLTDRAPTVLFGVAGLHADEVAVALARQQVAVWSGDCYAVEVAHALALADADNGVGVRGGVVRYCSPDDVQQLLRAVDGLARP
jgi:cysteine desulfurase family protein (TIGR01976 family)